MAYDKADVVGLGHAAANLVNVVRSDGAGVDDLDEALAVLKAAAESVNEMQEVPEAAGEHILGAFADKLGDYALAKALAGP